MSTSPYNPSAYNPSTLDLVQTPSDAINQVEIPDEEMPTAAKADAPAAQLPQEFDRFAPDPLPGDFISTYSWWADIVELPWVLHEAAAIQLVAAILNRNKVFIQNGGIWYPMDLWMALLSRSGGGRSTILNVARDVLGEGKFDKSVVQNCFWGSVSAMQQELSNDLEGHFYFWGELSTVLKSFDSGLFTGAKEWFTDLYDNSSVPAAKVYRKDRNGNSNTEPITFSCAPRINILAASSEAWFYDHLSDSDNFGGWLPRWVFVCAGENQRSVPRPIPHDPKIRSELAQQLCRIDQLKGQAQISEEILKDYDRWYTSEQERFKAHPRRDLAEPYFGRYRGLILKLAVIYEASSMGLSSNTTTINVSWQSWERAKKKCIEWSNNLFEMLKTGMSSIGQWQKKFLDHIGRFGDSGISQNEFTRAFQTVEPTIRETNLATLLKSRQIHTFHRKTAGKPAHMFVLEEFCGGRCTDCVGSGTV